MNSCGCTGVGSPAVVAGACAKPSDSLPSIKVEDVLFPGRGKGLTASFRWAESSAGDPLLEVELSGKTRWIEVLTTKP